MNLKEKAAKAVKALKALTPEEVRAFYIIILVAALVLAFIAMPFRSLAILIIATLLILADVIFYCIFYRCPHCGKSLGRDSAKYCPHCGKELNK